MFDAIIIGAGPGGLTSGVNLTKYGYKVLILEGNYHYGGTSAIFKRRGFSFPMGPLSFSSPKEVKELLSKIGIKEELNFTRNEFQLIAPSLNIIYSQPLSKLKEELVKIFQEEKLGIESFFGEMEQLIKAVEHIHDWHPAYKIKGSHANETDDTKTFHEDIYELIEKYSKIPAKNVLERYISNDTLFRFLGTLGTGVPKMSMLLLTIMWYLMCEKGIWYPSGGIHGVTELLYNEFVRNGGEIKLSTLVNEILIENGRAVGVKTKDNEVYEGRWIVSNSDYKSTFLNLINPHYLSENFVQLIKKIQYFGSEFSVYLGVNPQKVDLSRVKAQHLFYRKEKKPDQEKDIGDFDNREIEICFWSDNDSSLAPPGRKVLVIRAPFSYDFFSEWKLGEKGRKEGYAGLKRNLAHRLINTVENILPGLSASIDIMEISTPLTYERFSHRYQGSIAGWSWDIADKLDNTNKLLIETPIPNLLMVGLYASAELFLGGVPTSMHTGYWASEIIRNSEN